MVGTVRNPFITDHPGNCRGKLYTAGQYPDLQNRYQADRKKQDQQKNTEAVFD